MPSNLQTQCLFVLKGGARKKTWEEREWSEDFNPTWSLEKANAWGNENKHVDKTPSNVTDGSGQQALWQCDKNTTHRWVATIASRATKGSNCPHCNNKGNIKKKKKTSKKSYAN